MNNYRPISVRPSFSKIIERLVHKRLYSYVTKFNILTPEQFGFQKNFSTYMAQIDLYDNISKAIDEKKYPIGIFIDLKKAFDTVDFNIPVQKLNHYGVHGLALKWFKNYLSNRRQYVSVNGIDSSWKTVTCGIPQESILGPLLFLLYNNDIVNCSQIIHFIIFADDTTLFFSGEDIATLIDTINCELKKLLCWFKANKLSLNYRLM